MLVVALAMTGVIPIWPGLVHLVALPPLDMFADLRILILRTDSWPAFLTLTTVVTAARVALMAWLLGGLDARRLRFAALFYAAAFGPILLATFLDAAAFAVLYSRVFWPALTLIAVLVLILGPVPWQRATTLHAAIGLAWRRGLRVEVMLPYCAVLLALGALADRVPTLTVLLVPVSAAATGFAVRLMERAPLARPVTALAVTILVASLSWATFVQTRGYENPEPGPPQEGSILIMSGINSRSGRGAIHSTDIHRLGFDCEQVYYFSYAGPGDGQPQRSATCPIRTGAEYGPSDTQRPVEEQVAAFAQQTAHLPRPLVVAAHSHAVWIVWEAVATHRAQVDVLLLVGPFPDNPIGYPPPGVDARGRVLGDLLRWAAPATDLVDFNFDPDTPAAAELLANEGVTRGILGQPLPAHVRTLSITSATDLPLMPGGWRLDVEHNACPARVAHPYLPKSAAFNDEVIRFLERRQAPNCPAWRDWGAIATRAIGVPPGAS